MQTGVLATGTPPPAHHEGDLGEGDDPGGHRTRMTALILFAPVVAVVAVVALVLAAGQARKIEALRREVERLGLEVDRVRVRPPASHGGGGTPATPTTGGTPTTWPDRAQAAPTTSATPAAPSPGAAQAAPTTSATPAAPSPGAAQAAPTTSGTPAVPWVGAAPAGREAGEPPASRDVGDLERRIGQRWTTWVGATALLVGAVLFVRYAFAQGWLGPTARVASGLAFGLALVAAGDRFVRRGFRPLGQGLMGAGQGILYGSLYAAWGLYALVSRDLAFAAMVVVTVGGMVLAVRHDARATSVLALVGGFLTPVLVATGTDPRDLLFAYVLLLDVGALAVAAWRGWRGLDWLASAGTWAYALGWHDRFFEAGAAVPIALWALAFHGVLAVLPVLPNLLRRTEVPLARSVLGPLNLAAALAWAWSALHPTYETALGMGALGAAAGQMLLATALRRRVPPDPWGTFVLVGGGVVVAAIAAPLLLDRHLVAVVWALGAPALHFAARRIDDDRLGLAALALLAAAAVRLVGVHVPLHAAPFAWPFLNAAFAPVAGVALGAAAVWLVARAGPLRTAATTSAWVPRAALHGAVALLLVFGHVELDAWLLFAGRDDARLWAVVVVWLVGAAGYLAAVRRAGAVDAWVGGLLTTAVALVLAGAALFDEPVAGALPFASPRFAVALVATLLTFALAHATRRAHFAERDRAAALLALAGVTLLLVFLSGDLWIWLLRGAAPATAEGSSTGLWRAHLGLSVLWCVYATALLGIGFRRRARWLRLSGLALFGLTAAKLLAYDLAGLDEIYRILSFLIVGAVLVAASWGYHRAERRLAPAEGRDGREGVSASTP